ENVLCGPASNIALAQGNGKYAVYICSKEGFIAKHGWEKMLIRQMDAHPDHALSGYKTHLPKYTLGSELIKHPDFSKFRNQHYARDNPDKVFTHVQGGAFILRRSIVESHGGFSLALPQA